MPFSVEEGMVEIEALLRTEAAEQEVPITMVQWFAIGNPPRHFNLEVHGTTHLVHAKNFTPRHLSEWDSDPQMMMQVNQRLVAIVAQLKKYVR